MKKWIKNGLIYTFLFTLLNLTTGCSVDDAQETAAAFYSSAFAKADQPSAEKRMKNRIHSFKRVFWKLCTHFHDHCRSNERRNNKTILYSR